MVRIHNLGFPRIGENRELKFSVEKYWRGELSAEQLREIGQQLRSRHWRMQQSAGLDMVPVNDFANYDHMLDMSFLLDNIPSRFRNETDKDRLAQYFHVARGHSHADTPAQAGEMTKWFDTNYHYIVPELEQGTSFTLMPEKILGEIEEAIALGIPAKPVLIGPCSYLWLAKTKHAQLDKLDLLDDLVTVYGELLQQLVDAGITWVQIDEPIMALDLPQRWQAAISSTYAQLHTTHINILLAVYFGSLQDNLDLVINLPVAGVHVDAVRGRSEVQQIVGQLPDDKVLSLGVIDGHNIWKSDLDGLLDWLEPIHGRLADRLWLAPSCSLLHVPVNLDMETALDADIYRWLAFAKQKLDELAVLARALNDGRASVHEQLSENARALESRRNSQRVFNPAVRERVQRVTPTMKHRAQPYPERASQQKARFQLPTFPTTTIGSFPQTSEIRKVRRAVRNGVLSQPEYAEAMRQQIAYAIHEQESYGLDVLVHGEAERNDMVEYFGEQLRGYAFTQFGWVQSYGSRCVKPPIIYGDVSRPQPITVPWSRYAQSLTEKPVKGMLTGPVTMLQWAFVRDDQPRCNTAEQIALALRDEVLDLEQGGIAIIQVDEPAFREGLPLHKAEWNAYLAWAGDAFRLTTSGVKDDTQIHTHMCYSEFNDIIDAIAMLDADVITIETSRSDMELLEAFTNFKYPNEIGPGVYDIHSPNIPTVEEIITLVNTASSYIPADRLWINPDCGLKTRQWHEVRSSLINMVKAAEQLRDRLGAESNSGHASVTQARR